LNGAWTARAFPMPPAKTKGMIATTTGKTLDDAIENLKAKLTEEQAAREGDRRWDEVAQIAVPLKSEFIYALSQLKLSTNQVSMLKAHAIADAAGMTLHHVVKSAQQITARYAIAQYGLVGRRIGEVLNIDLKENAARSSDALVPLMASERAGDSDVVWVMHTELASAVREMP
jgi:hypothetical protein